jgi:hypothetical protein
MTAGPAYTHLNAPGWCSNCDITGSAQTVADFEAFVTTPGSGRQAEETLILGKTLTRAGIQVCSRDAAFFYALAAHALRCADRLHAAGQDVAA